jgi:hypothetical protein
VFGAASKLAVMDDKFKAILESIPKKRERSKLEPFTELIKQLRRRGHTYREIARILAEKCNMVVASSTLFRFAATLAREERKYPKHPDDKNRAAKCRQLLRSTLILPLRMMAFGNGLRRSSNSRRKSRILQNSLNMIQTSRSNCLIRSRNPPDMDIGS